MKPATTTKINLNVLVSNTKITLTNCAIRIKSSVHFDFTPLFTHLGILKHKTTKLSHFSVVVQS